MKTKFLLHTWSSPSVSCMACDQNLATLTDTFGTDRPPHPSPAWHAIRTAHCRQCYRELSNPASVSRVARDQNSANPSHEQPTQQSICHKNNH